MFSWIASKLSKSGDSSSTEGASSLASPKVRPIQRPLVIAPVSSSPPRSPQPFALPDADVAWQKGDAPVSEIVVKIVVVGGTAVGKTSLIYRYVHGCTSSAYFPTIGVDVVSAYLSHNCAPKPVRVDFWDVPFAELYGHGIPRILEGASGIAYVFDNAVADSIDAIDEWRRTVRSHRQAAGTTNSSTSSSSSFLDDASADKDDSIIPGGCPSVLLVHKSDKKKNLLTNEQLQQYCTDSKYAFWQRTTVADPSSINKAIGLLCEKALDYELAVIEARNKARIERERTAHIRIDPAVLAKAAAIASSRNGGASSLSSSVAAGAKRGVPVDSSTTAVAGSLPVGKATAQMGSSNISKKAEDMSIRISGQYSQLHEDLLYILEHPCMAPELRQYVAALDEQQAAECDKLTESLKRIAGAQNDPVSTRKAAIEKTYYQFLKCAAKWQKLVRQLVDELGITTVASVGPCSVGRSSSATEFAATAASLSLTLSQSEAPGSSSPSPLSSSSFSPLASPAPVGYMPLQQRLAMSLSSSTSGVASPPVCVPVARVFDDSSNPTSPGGDSASASASSPFTPSSSSRGPGVIAVTPVVAERSASQSLQGALCRSGSLGYIPANSCSPSFASASASYNAVTPRRMGFAFRNKRKMPNSSPRGTSTASASTASPQQQQQLNLSPSLQATPLHPQQHRESVPASPVTFPTTAGIMSPASTTTTTTTRSTTNGAPLVITARHSLDIDGVV